MSIPLVYEVFGECTDFFLVDCYRNKTRAAIEGAQSDVQSVAPHFETRTGKRRWSERVHRGEKRDD